MISAAGIETLEACADSKSPDGQVHTAEADKSPSDESAAFKKLIRKLDAHCLPAICFLWFSSFVDRVNIGMARLDGLEKDLGMVGNDFNIALTIFFASIIVFEVPSNLIMAKMKPYYWLPLQNFCLAICTIGEGVVTTKGGLYAMRFLIGLFEAGLVPGSIFLLSAYYPRHSRQWRFTVLLVGNCLASAFGGLLAIGISTMSGDDGYLGWRWIFIIEGALTAAISIICIAFVPDWPEKATWLSKDEKAILVTMISDQAGEHKMDRLDSAALKRCLLDWKVWTSTIIFITTICTSYAIALFSPSIISRLNHLNTPRQNQALAIPIFISSAIMSLTVAYLSDRTRHRYTFAIVGYAITLVGLVLFFCQEHLSTGVLYFGLYLVAIGTYICLPLVWTMLANNVSGHYKTSIACGIVVGIGNSGGIIASCTFSSTMAPHYWKGYYVDFAMTAVAAVVMTGLVYGLKAENRKRDAGERDERFNLPPEELANLGDDHPDFRFVW